MKLVILIAKGNSSSYNIISQIYLGKCHLLHLTLLYLYKIAKPLDCPLWPLGSPCYLWAPPQLFNLTILSFSECCTTRYIKLKFNRTFIKRDQLGHWWTFPKPGPLLLLILLSNSLVFWDPVDLRPSLSASLSIFSSLCFSFIFLCCLPSALSFRYILLAVIVLSWK